jgi:8-oxo-dGTP pyrophosphatase MutT (NUDIX family)
MALRTILKAWRDRLMPRKPAATRQFGAIPYMVVENRTLLLIITSRGRGRWIFPKGSAIEGLQPWEVAAREAYEEAGVEGTMETVPLGVYRDMKSAGVLRKPLEVELYPLRLSRELETWREQGARQRRWVTVPEAKQLLANPQLGELAVLLDRRLRAAMAHAGAE